MKIEIIDGFVWAILNEETAMNAYMSDSEVYELHDDGSESLIIDSTDITLAVHNGKKLGFELGHEAELKADWREATARNKETRSFEAWLQDKAEALIN